MKNDTSSTIRSRKMDSVSDFGNTDLFSVDQFQAKQSVLANKEKHIAKKPLKVSNYQLFEPKEIIQDIKIKQKSNVSSNVHKHFRTLSNFEKVSYLIF